MPAVLPCLALLAGAACGLASADSFSISWAACLTLAGGVIAAMWGLWSGSARPLVVGVAIAFFAGGATLGADAWHRAWRPSLRVVFEDVARGQRAEADVSDRRLAEDDVASVVVTGVLRADASPVESGVSLSLGAVAVEPPGRPAVSVDGGVLLTVVGDLVRDRIAEWRAGRLIRAPAQLRRTSRYLDPGVPDEERALARRGTTLVGTVKSGALVDVVARGNAGAEAAGAVRAFARRAIDDAVGRWSPRAAAIVLAIVIGDRAGLDPALQRRLQEAGTYHVIAISGGNIAILAGLILGVFRVVGVLGPSALLSAASGLVAYGYLVGGGASVDRATLMAVIYLVARAVDLRGPPLNTLAVVAALLVAADPLAVADPAFLLTCGATAAILVAYPLVSLERLPPLVSQLAAVMAASLAAEASLLPIGAALFSRVTVAGLALNLAAIPMMAVAQIAGMVLVPVALVSARLAVAVGWIAYFGAEGLVRSSDLVTFVPVLAWRVPPPGWMAIAGYYSGGLIAFWLWSRPAVFDLHVAPARRRLFIRTGGAVTVLSGLWIGVAPVRFLAAWGDGQLHVTFIDVGQGDAALLRLPRGATMLVDTGGLSARSSFDIGDRVVAPVLREAGVTRLDDLVLTHGDADHIGGAPSVLTEFRPRDVWEGIPVPAFEPLLALRATAADLRVPWTHVQSADATIVDDVEIFVRHPGQADWERQKVRNDDSVVLELRWRKVSVVLTGDIGRETEEAIASQFLPAPLRILKVPHHGSLGSSSAAFVRALAPRLAVFSVGRRNVFGHPAPAVVERYRLLGAEIARTDRDGAVTVDTDGESARVRTFTGREVRLRAP